MRSGRWMAIRMARPPAPFHFTAENGFGQDAKSAVVPKMAKCHIFSSAQENSEAHDGSTLLLLCKSVSNVSRELLVFSEVCIRFRGAHMHNGSGEHASHMSLAATTLLQPRQHTTTSSPPTSATRTRPPLSTAIRTWPPHTLRTCVGQRVPVAVSRSTAVLHPRIAR